MKRTGSFTRYQQVAPLHSCIIRSVRPLEKPALAGTGLCEARVKSFPVDLTTMSHQHALEREPAWLVSGPRRSVSPPNHHSSSQSSSAPPSRGIVAVSGAFQTATEVYPQEERQQVPAGAVISDGLRATTQMAEMIPPPPRPPPVQLHRYNRSPVARYAVQMYRCTVVSTTVHQGCALVRGNDFAPGIPSKYP